MPFFHFCPFICNFCFIISSSRGNWFILENSTTLSHKKLPLWVGEMLFLHCRIQRLNCCSSLWAKRLLRRTSIQWVRSCAFSFWWLLGQSFTTVTRIVSSDQTNGFAICILSWLSIKTFQWAQAFAGRMFSDWFSCPNEVQFWYRNLERLGMMTMDGLTTLVSTEHTPMYIRDYPVTAYCIWIRDNYWKCATYAFSRHHEANGRTRKKECILQLGR